MSALLSGAAIGFAVAAPVGPIGVLCIRTSLESGGRAGLAAGLGAAVADTLYAAVCVFAVGVVTRAITEIASPLHTLGSVAIVAIGVRIFLIRSPARGSSVTVSHSKIFRTTLLLTLANPTTLVSFTAIVASAALGPRSMKPADGVALVVGVFIGSALWWLALSAVTGSLKRALPPRGIDGISRVSGCALCLFGIFALLRSP